MAQTITVPSSVPSAVIQRYVAARRARRKKFKYGVEATDHSGITPKIGLKQRNRSLRLPYAGYKHNLDIVYPLIGDIRLQLSRDARNVRELRKRGAMVGLHQGNYCRYLETVSSVLESTKNSIIPFNGVAPRSGAFWAKGGGIFTRNTNGIN